MDEVMQNKRGLELVTDRSSGSMDKLKKVPLLVMHYLTKFDDVIQSAF